MENANIEEYKTELHSNELDFLYNENSEDFEKTIFQDKNYFDDLKVYLRLFRKRFSLFMREKMQKNFTNIIYLTLDCPPYTNNSAKLDSPLEYISEMRNQYPDNDIRVLIPIYNMKEDIRCSKKITVETDNKTYILEKTSINFEFFLQNKTQQAVLYKYPKDNNNIQVYGIYCQSFSKAQKASDFSKIQLLAPFIKASRIVIKKLAKENFEPDIIHAENIPFFLGGEFELNLPYKIKILQTIKDFILWDVAKTEAFWAAINLADKKAMKKICRDEVIKNCIAKLFNLHNEKHFYKMKECLDFIYKNYYKFRKYVDKGDDVEENYIFNKLNTRIIKIFPQIAQEDKNYFNPMINSIKRADYWITTSKSYYKEIFENPDLSGNLYKYIEKTKEKSNYSYYGIDLKKYPLENTRQVYFNYNKSNFREERIKNKKALLKEFAIDRIKTNFIDPTLFYNQTVQIVGHLDSFYEAPIFFANPNAEIFAEGIDILFNTMLKIFELHKNAQFIFCIKDGLKNTYINNWIKFLEQNKYFNGKWVFIDGDIHLPKFLSGTDMILLPRRVNLSSPIHYIAMHYGCVPVTSCCGILNDTISNIFDDISNGCGFKTKQSLIIKEEDTNKIYLATILKALNLYQNNPSSWNLLIKNCMNYDSSWNFKILEKYNKIYKELI